MIKWAGWLILLYGAAHTLGALTIEGAGGHAAEWFSGQLWDDDLSNMSAAGNAFWLSIDSFGPMLVLIGMMVLWMQHNRVVPPMFVPAALLAWNLIDAAALLYTPWPIITIASILLMIGVRRAKGNGT
ncbi:hypothetical protein FF80_00882 [Devosia sp. LC5]|uniref:hypothetical protein n=1 Tax=Devosia sp. LC5 TaxID=1502724 RepID=UPI0004E40820|nr:hypothetical protein [Devosia sp. LC5]KFC70610.1 hypothetical protein FF80_00882 [Devosia sp. LC5]